MKTSLTFLYDNKTGNIQYIDKTRFIKEFCGSLSQKNNKIIDLQEVKKLNSSTYRDILKKYDKSFLKLSPGIQSIKLNQNTQLILLLDKTTEDFEKYCKKNNWKFGQEVEKLNNISDDIKPNLSLLKNKKKSQESPQKQGIIYSKEKVSLNDSLQKIWQYKPKETKEELKMKNKNIVKKVAVASLAALISVPNIVGSTNTYAAYNQEYESYNGLANIVSGIPQGNYTLITDEYGEQGLVHTSQWNEYQLMLNQGSPKVICTWVKGYSSGSKSYYGIIAYQLAGQQKVTLPENAVIKVTDNYNLDHLSVLKYLGNQLGSSYLFNVNDSIKKEEEKIKREKAQIASEYARQQAQAIADQQQIDLNNQINAELNAKSENKAGQKTALPYSSDYIKNYSLSQVKISHDKIWASFDNERNYIQQWLTANGFKNLKELENIRYNWKTKEDEEKSAKYSSQSKAAQQYYKDIESGILPQNCSMGDWIRYNLKKNLMGGWNGLAQWTDKVDISIVNYGGQYNDKLMSYQDIYNVNKEIYRMIESDLSTIASYENLTKEQKTTLVEQLKNQFISPFGDSQGKKYVSEYESRTELINKIRNKWKTEYLPNIKENN